MALTLTLTANNNPQIFRHVSFKGAAETITIDARALADDIGAISTATWSVESGEVDITSESLSSSQASALLTYDEQGRNLVKVTLDTGTDIYVVFLFTLARDPYAPVWDYGYRFP